MTTVSRSWHRSLYVHRRSGTLTHIMLMRVVAVKYIRDKYRLGFRRAFPDPDTLCGATYRHVFFTALGTEGVKNAHVLRMEPLEEACGFKCKLLNCLLKAINKECDYVL